MTGGPRPGQLTAMEIVGPPDLSTSAIERYGVLNTRRTLLGDDHPPKLIKTGPPCLDLTHSTQGQPLRRTGPGNQTYRPRSVDERKHDQGSPLLTATPVHPKPMWKFFDDRPTRVEIVQDPSRTANGQRSVEAWSLHTWPIAFARQGQAPPAISTELAGAKLHNSPGAKGVLGKGLAMHGDHCQHQDSTDSNDQHIEPPPHRAHCLKSEGDRRPKPAGRLLRRSVLGADPNRPKAPSIILRSACGSGVHRRLPP